MSRVGVLGWAGRFGFALVFFASASHAVYGESGQGDAVVEMEDGGLISRMGRTDGGKVSLLGKDRVGESPAEKKRKEQNAQEAALLSGLADDAVFVQIGDDRLTWGALHNQVDAIFNTKISNLLSAAQGGADDLRLSLYKQGVSKLLQLYIKTSVIAYVAKQEGISVSEDQIKAEMSKIQGKQPTTEFEYQMVTNTLYQRAYVEKFMKPKVVIPEASIDELIKKRHETNLSVPLTNALIKAQIDSIRARIAGKEISFSDAAEEYSECPDCSMDGGDCGTWEEDDSDMSPALLKTCFSIPTNTLSEVVDTDEAYHLVMVVNRYEPTAKAREEDGEVSSVDVKHIQLDKWTVDPEYTHETAKKQLEGRVLARMLKAKQRELIGKLPIKSVIPIKESGANSRGTTFRFRPGQEFPVNKK